MHRAASESEGAPRAPASLAQSQLTTSTLLIYARLIMQNELIQLTPAFANFIEQHGEPGIK